MKPGAHFFALKVRNVPLVEHYNIYNVVLVSSVYTWGEQSSTVDQNQPQNNFRKY